ncbi:MAG: hypothetical protein E7585_01775 [Ruminococcaceae bacterium]|nr:hypothetical protein [Oscillospiraceae bacterium]
MFDTIFWIVWFVLILIGAVVIGIWHRRFMRMIWCVTVDGKEYGPVTALEFEARKNEVSFVHIEENCVYRLTYNELKYFELVPCEKNGDVDVFEDQSQ